MSENRAYFKDRRLGVFCCGHIFRRERVVGLVSRPDGDWQFVCGQSDHSDPNEPYHVAVGVLVDTDPSLDAVSDVPPWGEAERANAISPWIRILPRENNTH